MRHLLPSAQLELKGAYHLWNTSGLPGIRVVPCALATLSDPGGTYANSRYRLHIAVCDIEDCIDFRSSYLRGCIASRFRIAALVLLCLRLNLTSRLRLQG